MNNNLKKQKRRVLIFHTNSNMHAIHKKKRELGKNYRSSSFYKKKKNDAVIKCVQISLRCLKENKEMCKGI